MTLEQVQNAGPPGGTVTVVSYDDNPLVIPSVGSGPDAGTGSGSTTIHLSVPSSIAATSIPDGTAGAHDGVYEMR